jgi:hypothetical protein
LEFEEVCEFAALLAWLAHMPDAEARRFAALIRLSVPPKKRDRVRAYILSEWLAGRSREEISAQLRLAFRRAAARLRELPARAQARAAVEFIPLPGALWALSQAGVKPEKALRRLKKAEREQVEREVARLQQYADELRAWRESRRRNAEKPVEELRQKARALAWKAETAEAKHERAESAIEAKARELEEAREALKETEALLQEAESRIASLEEERRILIDQIALLSQDRREAMPRRAPTDSLRPLDGLRVLVVGDDGRQLQYRAVVEELGGEAEFLDGFASPKHLEARAGAADVVVMITAFMSHRSFQVLRRSAASTVFVNTAGVASFKAVLEEFARGAREAI